MSEISERIQEKVDSLREEIRILSDFSPHYDEITPLIREFEEESSIETSHYFYVGYSEGKNCIRMCIRMDGKKWKEVLPLVSDIRQHLGYAIDRDEEGSAVRKLVSGFGWKMGKEVAHSSGDSLFRIELEVDLNVWHNDEDDVKICRRVQVGTETIETPVYKIVCPEDL